MPRTSRRTAPPPAKVMLADRGYDAAWFRKALADRKVPIRMTNPSVVSAIASATHPYPLRSLRSHLLSAIAFAASFIFWLNQ